MAYHISIDIESLGVRPGSVILSVGAVEFHRFGFGREYYGVIHRPTCLTMGMTMDDSTIAWWSRQPESARQILDDTLDFNRSKSLILVLNELSDFCNQYPRARVWFRGPHFDGALLQDAYSRFNWDTPWKYYDVRDQRTIAEEIPYRLIASRQGINHHALDDAKHQAMQIAGALEFLRHEDFRKS